MVRGLVFGWLIVGLFAGCRSGTAPSVVEVQYPELGPEFLPGVIELFERGGEDALQCHMVYVLWALESRMPQGETGGISMGSVLCLCEGATASGKMVHRLLHVNRSQEPDRVSWKQASRVGIDATGAYTGSRSFPARPTLEELDKFVKRAELQNILNFHNLKLEHCPSKSHHFYVRARVYEQECREVFGRVPATLNQHTQERYADDPAPPTSPKS